MYTHTQQYKHTIKQNHATELEPHPSKINKAKMKTVIRTRNLMKDTQYNSEQKKNSETNNGQQNTTEKTKDLHERHVSNELSL